MTGKRAVAADRRRGGRQEGCRMVDDKDQTDASAMADAVLGEDDPPFRPPAEPASEPAETSVAKEGDAVEEPPE